MFCMLLFNVVYYVLFLLCLCILILCMFRFKYCVSLCCFGHCLCVNVYCTTGTGCQPNCNFCIKSEVLTPFFNNMKN